MKKGPISGIKNILLYTFQLLAVPVVWVDQSSHALWLYMKVHNWSPRSKRFSSALRNFSFKYELDMRNNLWKTVPNSVPAYEDDRHFISFDVLTWHPVLYLALFDYNFGNSWQSMWLLSLSLINLYYLYVVFKYWKWILAVFYFFDFE